MSKQKINIIDLTSEISKDIHCYKRIITENAIFNNVEKACNDHKYELYKTYQRLTKELQRILNKDVLKDINVLEIEFTNTLPNRQFVKSGLSGAKQILVISDAGIRINELALRIMNVNNPGGIVVDIPEIFVRVTTLEEDNKIENKLSIIVYLTNNCMAELDNSNNIINYERDYKFIKKSYNIINGSSTISNNITSELNYDKSIILDLATSNNFNRRY